MGPKRIHYFQHAAFEGLGSIERWAIENSHILTSTKFHEDPRIPDIKGIDWLIIMGGPMNIYEEDKYPWLRQEKDFTLKAIRAGKTVVGICLGSQLIADVLGAKIQPNTKKEIGWFNITATDQGISTGILAGIETTLEVFHWHGDTFDLPGQTIPLYESEACKNQAFLYKNNVLGLQFHLEITAPDLKKMIENGRHELQEDIYVQSEKEMITRSNHTASLNRKLSLILDRLPG